MTFLNTAILFGLIAGAIPIIIHLITRQKAKTVFFSTIRFLKELQNQQIKRLKIRQILLLILRTLIILFLIFAFARPTLKGHFSGDLKSSAKTSAVLVLDNSLSMAIESKGQQIFDLAKKRVQELEELFRLGDEISAVFASVGNPLIFDGPKYNFNNVNNIIQKTKVSQRQTDLIGALLKAREILEQASNINKEIYLISDFQQPGFKNIENLILPLFQNQEIKIFMIPIHSDQLSNLVVTDVKPANQIIEKGKVFELEATIRNYGTRAERNKLVQVFVEDKRLSQATIDLEPGKNQTVRFKIVPQNTGMISGSVLLEDDDLFLDNRRYFTFFVPEQIDALIIAPDEIDSKFLKLALNPGSDQSSQLKTDYLPPTRIESGTLKKYQVVILSNVPRVDGILLSSVSDYVRTGGGLIVFLGDKVDLRHYNENLNKKLSLPMFTETIGEMGQKEVYLTLGKIDFSHPIFSGVFEDEKKNIESPLFFFLIKMQVQPEQNNIIEFSNQYPFLLESTFDHGKVMLFATAIDPNWSDLHLKGIFVPIMNRCVAYLAGNANKSGQNYLINQVLSTNVSGIDNFTNFQVEKPDGKLAKIVPQVSEGYYKINFQESDIAGIYSLYSGNRLVTKWAVNPDPGESDVSKINNERLKEIIGETTIILVQNEQSLLNTITRSRYGNELWKYFIGIALIFLLIEMILARESENGKREK